jgi:ArsR family transcriptional regulator
MTEGKPTATADLARYLKAVADPLRLTILRLMAQDSFAVTELTQILDVTQSGMSHHLKLLSKAGLVASRREGNSIFYRRALKRHSELAELQSALFDEVDTIDLNTQTVQRLKSVRAERELNSKQFFELNSARFRDQQDLIAHFEVYADPIIELLEHTLPDTRKLAIEIGPGEGDFLHFLSEHFQQVIALDNNQNMLDKAAKRLDAERLANIRLQLDDAATFELEEQRADLIVANMVLHHLPSPYAIFERAAQQLNPGGSLLVTDLCLHDQSWAKEACGDIWLGFDPSELDNWAESNNLHIGQSMYFALRNGFQIQIRQFNQQQNSQ